MRMQLRDILTKLGHEIVGEAENGIIIDKHKKLKSDLITMDITMPEMVGIEADREIMSTVSTVRIIMCSAMGQKSMVIDAIKSGAMDFIIKPFNAAE